jgi:hypothetical protein
MEKSQSRSSVRKMPPMKEDLYNISRLVMDSRPPKPDKPSREEVSRAISIWANVYHLKDENVSDSTDLCLPSRPWMGRSPNSLKRFD